MTIKIELNMAEDFFGDILGAAIDPCPDWLQVGKCTFSDFGEYPLTAEVRPHWGEGKPFPEGDNLNDWQLVDHVKIEAAIQKIIDGGLINHPTRNAIFGAVCDGDACHIDSDAADAILQIAMFDELVFG